MTLLKQQKGPIRGLCFACSADQPPLRLDDRLLQPALDSVGAVLQLPLLEDFVVAAFGLHDFTAVRVLVALDFTRLALDVTGGADGTYAPPLGWIKNGDHLAQIHAVLFQQGPELLFKLDFLLQPGVVFHRIQLLKLRGQLRFQCFEFGKLRHGLFLGMRQVWE